MSTLASRWHALQNASASCIRLDHDRATNASASQTVAMRAKCNCRLARNRFEYQASVALPTPCACCENSAPSHVLEMLLQSMAKKSAMARHGERTREVQMQSAFDWVTITRAPQPQPRIIRRRCAKQFHSTPHYDHRFSAIIMESLCVTSLAASAD